MKKILISLGIIGVVAVIAIGATIAYFNDTETSTGNILIAGDLDLKVDHTHVFYNGLFCKGGLLVEQCELGNLVKNGGFEYPVVTHPQKWDIFPSGTPGLDWQLKWRADVPTTYKYGGVTYNRPEPALKEFQAGAVGPAKEGVQIAELDTDWFGPNSSVQGEPGSVHIYQSIPTIPGRQYKFGFWYSPRPGNSAANNMFDAYWDGVLLQSFNPGSSGTMNWQSHSATVTATGYSTIIEFVDRGPADSLGAFLDDVQVIAIECPTDNPQVGKICAPEFGEVDLTDEKFFNFEDVKPGDFGRNVISVHNYSNDGWLCMTIGNKSDIENDLIGPEANAGDVTPAQGELSKYLQLFVWRDDNNNGIYEPLTETVIGTYTMSTIGTVPVYDSTTGTGPLIASTTKFIGLAWCVGTINVDGTTGEITCNGAGNQDDAQTDKFMADLTLYTEQWRNNAGFVCPVQ